MLPCTFNSKLVNIYKYYTVEQGWANCCGPRAEFGTECMYSSAARGPRLRRSTAEMFYDEFLVRCGFVPAEAGEADEVATALPRGDGRRQQGNGRRVAQVEDVGHRIVLLSEIANGGRRGRRRRRVEHVVVGRVASLRRTAAVVVVVAVVVVLGVALLGSADGTQVQYGHGMPGRLQRR